MVGQESRPPHTSRANAASKPPAPKQLDLNTADVEALEAVPVIGAEVARAIVAARPFRTIDDLSRVPGITAPQLEQIKAVVKVDPATAPARRTATATSRASASPRTEYPARKVDLNTAKLETLAALPGATPDVDGLSRVKGITAEQLEQIRAAVVVQPAKLPAP